MFKILDNGDNGNPFKTSVEEKKDLLRVRKSGKYRRWCAARSAQEGIYIKPTDLGAQSVTQDTAQATHLYPSCVDMSYKVCIVLVVIGAAFADPGGYQPVYQSHKMPYHFDYGVTDHYKATDFGQNEKSDGKNVWGTYWVNLPDGRKQRVDYTADHYKGYVAKVSYYGKAHHPKHYGPAQTFFQNHGHGGHGYGYGH